LYESESGETTTSFITSSSFGFCSTTIFLPSIPFSQRKLKASGDILFFWLFLIRCPSRFDFRYCFLSSTFIEFLIKKIEILEKDNPKKKITKKNDISVALSTNILFIMFNKFSILSSCLCSSLFFLLT
jgi:hypothetical protein